MELICERGWPACKRGLAQDLSLIEQLQVHLLNRILSSRVDMDQYKLCTRGPAQDPSFIGQLQVHLPGNRILLPADMDQHKLCKRCELVTLDRLENGYLLHSHVSTLIAEAKRDGACKMCSLILFSLRHHHYSFCYDYEPEASVRLFLNPPPSRTSAKLHQVDIIVTDEENFCEFWWLPQEFGKPWLLAPPYQPHPSEDVFRGHLTLYSNQGTYITIHYGSDDTLIKH